MTRTHRPRRLLAAGSLAGLAAAAVLAAGCGSSSDAGAAQAAAAPAPAATHDAHATAAAPAGAKVALHSALQRLWGQHMEWTYATVDAFFHHPEALQPTLRRLLRNQRDIGAAIVPFYGKAAGAKLTRLLTQHIQGAVPVLEAARDGDKARLDASLSAWYGNARTIARLLSGANPANWPRSATEPMLRTHITQTTAYAVDLLKGDYARAIKHYDAAERHMLKLADVLAAGLIAQFPERFAG